MKDTTAIDVETVPQGQTMAIQRSEAGALARPMTVDELHRQLEFIREVMRKEMKEGTDFGKIPGTGDRKTLLQPGAQKLLMTFNLQEEVKKETLREYPGMHREYEFTLTVIAANGKRWDGVGTCSTLESKYRYRKMERKCPKCGKESIIQGKAEYGGGWVCWKKKGGCDSKFPDNEPGITAQAGGVVENEDPADVWNTCRKMAFKRALVAAAINATNTSELWTQDLEEMTQNDEIQKEKSKVRNTEKTSTNAPGRSEGVSTRTPPEQNAGKAAPANAPVANKPTPAPAAEVKPWPQSGKTREWMINTKLSRPDIGPGLVLEYFRKAGMLLPTEVVDDLPLRWLPADFRAYKLLEARILAFGAGSEAVKPYEPREVSGDARGTNTAPAATRFAAEATAAVEAAAPGPAPKELPPQVLAARKDPEWWRAIVVPIPPKGMRRAEYLKNPQTVGGLYDGRHDEATAKRLFGFIGHFEVETTWQNEHGQTRNRNAIQIEQDQIFRDALDACNDYAEAHHGDTDQRAEAPEEFTGPDEKATPFD